MGSQSALIEQSFDGRYSRSVREALDELPDSFTITDPCIGGHPIVFASPGFLKMSGYSREEVIGRNGRIFQGPGTDRRSVMEIREAIREERPIQINLLNYRKDGTPLWMLFHMIPVFDRDGGAVAHFVAVQVPISRPRRRSCAANWRNGVNLSGEVGGGLRDVLLGSCRREVCSDSLAELGHVSAFGSVLDSDSRGVEAEEPCEASDSEKRRAASAIGDIMSVLTRYSESTGRLVCGKRFFCPGSSLLSSSVIISLGRIKQSFVLTDVHLPDMPIVYASDAFLKLTGYSRHEVLGRNCRFLNGMDTDSSTLFQIKECIRIRQPCTVRILNYRKDGNSFWNRLHISPVRNASGKIAYFVGVQIEEDCENQGGDALSPEMRQRSTVGAVKVALRTMSIGAGTSRS
ncbi:protein TWIN LOV 1 isoform X1 [Syzygium oleosum]|uniref:protein TWIN LOV 1 isoform X1 n=1 Tax=Syzygium oleosum TaxID=219896 RepID=UPI0011D2B41E|nr:protein TWIN LOV 1 isoform X1 [Syzygium oleosum]XP_030442504.1 protein TWIN LOV 1 isoform X1 [Syzygium oleosum]